MAYKYTAIDGIHPEKEYKADTDLISLEENDVVTIRMPDVVSTPGSFFEDPDNRIVRLMITLKKDV